MEDSPNNSENSFQDKPDGPGGNPTLPFVGQDAFLIQQSPSTIPAEIFSRSEVRSSTPSSQSLNIDKVDETSEAGIGSISAKRKRSECDSEESETPADNLEQQSLSRSETEVARSDVESEEYAAKEKRPTFSRHGSNDKDSQAEDSDPDDLHPTGSCIDSPPEVESDSSSIVIDSPVGPSEVANIPTDKASSSKLLAQNPIVSDSIAERSNADDLHRTRSCINLPPKETLGEKGGTRKSGADSVNRTSETNVESSLEFGKLSGTSSLEMLLKYMVYEISSFSDLPEIQDAEVPMQGNSDPSLARQSSASIPSGPSTSRERSEVAMDQDPPYLDVHEGQPSTSNHQPVIPEGSSAGNRLNSSSGITQSGTSEWSRSYEYVSKHVLNAQSHLMEILKHMMRRNNEERKLFEFMDSFHSVSTSTSLKNERRLQFDFLVYLNKRYPNIMPPSRLETLDPNENTLDVLFHIVVVTLVSILSLWSIFNFEAIMDSYRLFKNLYEERSKFEENIRGKKLDKSSRERMESIDMLLLQTKNAFQLLLMHIGELADQKSIDRYVKQLLEEDKQFLRRSIG